MNTATIILTEKTDIPSLEDPFSLESTFHFFRIPADCDKQAHRGKKRITIRIDDDILDWFRQQAHAAGGGNYQTLINMALRKYMNSKRKSLEETLRHIIREELSAYGKKSQR